MSILREAKDPDTPDRSEVACLFCLFLPEFGLGITWMRWFGSILCDQAVHSIKRLSSLANVIHSLLDGVSDILVAHGVASHLKSVGESNCLNQSNNSQRGSDVSGPLVLIGSELRLCCFGTLGAVVVAQDQESIIRLHAI